MKKNLLNELVETLTQESCKNKFRGEHIILSQLYNEEWLIKIFLDWYSKTTTSYKYEFLLAKSMNWFSEASLPSIFHDNYTKADGVIGDFHFPDDSKASLIALNPDFKKVTFIEAKMGSGFSSKTTNGKDFDQISRYFGNMGAMLHDVYQEQLEFELLNFVAIYPKNSNHLDNIKRYVNNDLKYFLDKVNKREPYRVNQYDVELFKKVMNLIEKSNQHTVFITWEELIEAIQDDDFKHKFIKYYRKCCRYNKVECDI